MVHKIPVKDAHLFADQELGVSKWHTITERQIKLFGEVTGDDHWPHSDVERATKAFGGIIAQGFLTLSVVAHLWKDVAEFTDYRIGLNYGCDRTRFTAPVRPGDRVRLRATMRPPRPKGDGVILTVHCVVEADGKERPALVTDWSEMYFV